MAQKGQQILAFNSAGFWVGYWECVESSKDADDAGIWVYKEKIT